VNTEFVDSARFLKVEVNNTSKYPVFLEKNEFVREEYLLCFGRWLSDYQNYLRERCQTYQKTIKRVYGFLADQTRALEKMSIFFIKDLPQTYDKLKKRMQDIIGNRSSEYAKCVNVTL
jgi:hypothetical protein